ncbi:MAG: TolC family protein [Deltaproteobacteria bacterium]|nr:TolC family protein [Deltaproteobacteria bacterium]
MSQWARVGGMLLGLAMVLAPVGASAAGAPAAGAPKNGNGGPVLNYDQLTEMALKFSPDVKASRSEVKLAAEQKNEVHGYRWPQFDATALGGVAPKAHLARVQSIGGTMFQPDPKDKLHGISIFGHMDFTFIQPLYTFGKIAYREEATAKNIKVKEEGVVAKQGEIIVQVSQAYYGLILANQGKDAVKEAKSYLSDTKERINRLIAVRSPNVKATDKYRLAAYEGAVEKAGAEAEEGAKTAYMALKALTGYPANQDFQVPTDLPNPAAPAGTLDTQIRTALEMRPEFRQLKEGLVARQLLVDAAKADRLPSFFFAVVGQLAGAPGRKYNPDPYINDWFNDNGALPMVGAKWHFDFGILNAKIGQARAELEGLQNQERTALMGIPIEVAKNYGDVQTNYKGSMGMEKAYVNARRWLVTTFSNFDMGLGSISDTFQAFERYGVFRGDYLMAVYNYNLAVAQLDKSTGAYRRKLPQSNNDKPAFKPLPSFK